MKNRVKTLLLVILVVITGFFLYYVTKPTFTSYESNISGTIANDIAGIKIKINNTLITNINSTDVTIDDVSWTATHTREGKISPGAVGTITINIDPRESDVAFLFDFTLYDKQVETSKILTFSSLTSNDLTLVRTGENVYSGIITLDDIADNTTYDLSLNFLFSDEDIIGSSTDIGSLDDFFTIRFHAVQYNGETLVPYSE